MEFKNNMFVCLQVIVAISSVAIGVSGGQKTKIKMKAIHERTKHLNEVDQPRFRQNDIETHHSVTKNGTSKSKMKTRKCCQNGGRCILNSFCHCRKNFYGRFCQFEYKNRSCGTLKSGHFIRSDCDLCRCFDGYMYCIPRVYAGCEDEGFVDHSKKINPFKGKNVEVIPDKIDEKSLNLRTFDADKDYAYYYNDYDVTEKNMASSITSSSVIFLLPLFVFCSLDMSETFW